MTPADGDGMTKAEPASADGEPAASLRILHIVRQYLPAVGGMESFVRDLAAEQRAMGHAPAVLTLNRQFNLGNRRLPANETIDGVPVRRIGYVGRRRYFLPFLGPMSLRRADILHVHATDPFFDLVALLRFAARVPAVATTHGGFFHTPAYGGIKRLYFRHITRRTCRSYGALFANSEQDEGYFNGLHPNVIRLPNGVRPIGDITAEGRDLLYIGRLASHKNVDGVIRAVAALTGEAAASRLHIVGQEWDVRPDSLARLAGELGIADRVVLHGYLDDAALALLAAGCGLFVSGSTYEGFGMSMIEAMGVGLVPVVHPNPSFAELVGEAGVGRCADFADPPAAAAAIAEALARLGPGDRGRVRAFAERFSWRTAAARCVAEYRCLLAERRRPGVAG